MLLKTVCLCFNSKQENLSPISLNSNERLRLKVNCLKCKGLGFFYFFVTLFWKISRVIFYDLKWRTRLLKMLCNQNNIQLGQTDKMYDYFRVEDRTRENMDHVFLFFLFFFNTLVETPCFEQCKNKRCTRYKWYN